MVHGADLLCSGTAALLHSNTVCLNVLRLGSLLVEDMNCGKCFHVTLLLKSPKDLKKVASFVASRFLQFKLPRGSGKSPDLTNKSPS